MDFLTGLYYCITRFIRSFVFVSIAQRLQTTNSCFLSSDLSSVLPLPLLLLSSSNSFLYCDTCQCLFARLIRSLYLLPCYARLQSEIQQYGLAVT